MNRRPSVEPHRHQDGSEHTHERGNMTHEHDRVIHGPGGEPVDFEEVWRLYCIEQAAYEAYQAEQRGDQRKSGPVSWVNVRRLNDTWVKTRMDLRAAGGTPAVIRVMLNDRMAEGKPMTAEASGIDTRPPAVVELASVGSIPAASAGADTSGVRPAERRPVMAKAEMNVVGDVVQIEVAEGTCGDGCGAPVKGKYKQGHDARLRSVLGQAHRAGLKVSVNGKTQTAEAILRSHGMPIPVAKPKAEPKPKPAAKSTAKKSTARNAAGRKAASKRVAAKKS